MDNHISIFDEHCGGTPVFIHNDLHFGNILYDNLNSSVSGIVDFDLSRQLEKQY